VTTDADNGNWAETDVSSIEWSREAGKSSRGICKRLVELQHAACSMLQAAQHDSSHRFRSEGAARNSSGSLVLVEQGVVLVR
jgi:hypothetical protein